MDPRQYQVLFILEVLQGLVAEFYDDEIPELKQWFNKVESDDEDKTLLEQLSSGTWCVSLAAVEIKVEHLTRYLGLLGDIHEAKTAISLNLMSKGMAALAILLCIHCSSITALGSSISGASACVTNQPAYCWQSCKTS